MEDSVVIEIYKQHVDSAIDLMTTMGIEFIEILRFNHSWYRYKISKNDFHLMSISIINHKFKEKLMPHRWILIGK